MIRRLLMTILLLGSLLCCGHTVMPYRYTQFPGSLVAWKTIPIYIDKNFGAADLVSLDDSINAWNYALNGYIKLEVASTKFDMEPEIIRQCLAGGCWMIMRIDSSNPMVDDGASVNGQPVALTLAWVNDIGGNRMFIIRDRMRNEWVMGVSLHEMGHLLGAEHDNVYLMSAHYNWEDQRCVDYQAMKAVAEYQHLPVSRLNYCVYGEGVRPTSPQEKVR